MAGSRTEGNKRRGKLARRLFHVGAGCIPPLMGLLLPREWVLAILGILTGLMIVGEALRLLVPPVNKWLSSFVSPAGEVFKSDEAARPIGTTFFLAGAFLAFLIFPRDAAVAALFFTAVGDALAATVGERAGRTKIGNKSLEGSTAFLLSTLVVGAVLVMIGLPLGWPSVIGGALAATVVEALPIPIDDNLTVPLAAAAAIALV